VYICMTDSAAYYQASSKIVSWIDWLSESEYLILILSHLSMRSRWDEIFVRWDEMRSKFLWDEIKQNQIFMRWDEIKSDFYEMKWDEIKITWNQNKMRLNCDLWDETESESTWDQNKMRLNSHSVR